MYTEVFGSTLIELAEEDERIVAVTPAMPGGSGLLKFAERFPTRMFDVGIAEQHAATLCAALALEGMKPVFAVYSTFMQRAYDQIVHDICRQNANVIFAIDRAGFVGADGETHQGVYDIAFMRSIPNMTIMMPKDENELRHMMKTAVMYDGGPIAVRYPRESGTGVELDRKLKPIPIGTWETVREGAGYAILAVGPSMLKLAEETAELMKSEGIQIRIVNARFIKPLDEEMLNSLYKEGYHLVTLEEGTALGGFGSAVLEYYAANNIHDMKVKVIGVPDYFVEHGSQKEQRQEVGLTPERVATEIKALMPRKRQRA
jgi:1-deoxy-D-xylulose-5-phosphate synthase